MNKFFIVLAFIFAAVLASFLGLLQLPVIAVPLVLGIALSNVLESMAVQMEIRGAERSTAVLFAFFLGAIVALLLVLAIASELAGELSVALDDPGRIARRIDVTMAQFFSVLPSALDADAAKFKESMGTVVHEGVANILVSLPTILVQMLLVLLTTPLVTYFLLRDGRSSKKALLEMVPNRQFEMMTMMLYRAGTNISGYIRGVAYEAILVGAVAAVLISTGSLIFDVDVPSTLLIATIAAATNVVPFVGPMVGTAIGSAIAFVSPDPSAVWLVLSALLAGQILDNVVFAPLVLGNAVSVHPVIVIVLLVVAGKWFGVMGMLVAVPTYAVVTVFLQETYWAMRHHGQIAA